MCEPGKDRGAGGKRDIPVVSAECDVELEPMNREIMT